MDNECSICLSSQYPMDECGNSDCQQNICNSCINSNRCIVVYPYGQYCNIYHLYNVENLNYSTIDNVLKCIFDNITWASLLFDDQQLLQNQINSINVKQKNFSYFILKKFLIKDIANIVIDYLLRN